MVTRDSNHVTPSRCRELEDILMGSLEFLGVARM